jgi:hypothetical protein
MRYIAYYFLMEVELPDCVLEVKFSPSVVFCFKPGGVFNTSDGYGSRLDGLWNYA